MKATLTHIQRLQREIDHAYLEWRTNPESEHYKSAYLRAKSQLNEALSTTKRSLESALK